MTPLRTATGLALAAVLVSIAPSAAQAAAGPADTTAAKTTQWGPTYSPGRKAKALGSLTASDEDHEDIPAAGTVRISGRLHDLTRKGTACGWAVFRVTYRTPDGNLPFRHRSVSTCSYGTSKPFAFAYHDVYEVELKVCAEPKAAKPSLTCLYAGTWKVLYVSS
ncbi:hypothetical protein FHR32_000459 [Streptosporangium album]|uniref:Secreted protein n=1 Tax=Streptosporangium album TaxID=47479 RepID=A0A7W7RQ65_9ACTN|nr:hypothetical protein [Streptosporangium album]MBB4936154.1 hypothetical protein [Streptosporangium album]